MWPQSAYLKVQPLISLAVIPQCPNGLRWPPVPTHLSLGLATYLGLTCNTPLELTWSRFINQPWRQHGIVLSVLVRQTYLKDGREAKQDCSQRYATRKAIPKAEPHIVLRTWGLWLCHYALPPLEGPSASGDCPGAVFWGFVRLPVFSAWFLPVLCPPLSRLFCPPLSRLLLAFLCWSALFLPAPSRLWSVSALPGFLVRFAGVPSSPSGLSRFIFFVFRFLFSFLFFCFLFFFFLSFVCSLFPSPPPFVSPPFLFPFGNFIFHCF